MNYTNIYPLPRRELEQFCIDELIETETFEKIGELPEFYTFEEAMNGEMVICKILSENLIKEHGAGTFDVQTWLDESKMVNIIRVRLTVYKVKQPASIPQSNP